MTERRLRTAAFTGHRDYRGEGGEALLRAVRTLCDEGVDTFLCGMAVGFDLAAAEAVIAVRRERPAIRLVAVLPFAEQSARFGAEERRRYDRLLAEADETVLLAERYAAECYRRRNDFLVDHASRLVAWYDGRSGGTQYTFRRALRRGLRIENLAPALNAREGLFASEEAVQREEGGGAC